MMGCHVYKQLLIAAAAVVALGARDGVAVHDAPASNHDVERRHLCERPSLPRQERCWQYEQGRADMSESHAKTLDQASL